MPTLGMSPQVFAILSTLIEERVGLHYGIEDLELLRDKIATRVLDAGFESFLDYYYYLRYDEDSQAEFQRLVDALVVGETYFFREYDQLAVLVDHLIPAALRRRPRVRVWSAACASGEEPLTVAMMLQQRNLLDRVELVASDVSQQALDRARSGIFGRRSVRILPEPQTLEFALRPVDGGYRVRPELLSAVDWRQVNLVEEPQVRALGVFDFILCRNVLIYFRDETARKVVDHLTLALHPDGALFVSVSESLMRFGTTLSCEELEGVFMYRKVR